MTCTLYKDNKLVCNVEDEGEGGAVLYRFKTPEEANAFDAFVAEWGETTGARARNDIAMAPYRREGADIDAEEVKETARSLWLIEAEQKYEEEKNFKARLKTGTPFRLKSDPAEKWRWLNMPYSESVKAWLLKEYGDKIDRIYDGSEAAPATTPEKKVMSDFNQVRANAGTLVEVSEAHYDEAKGAVPPISCGGFWAMGEPYDIRDGATVYYHYKKVGDRFYGCLATTQEAKQLFETLTQAPRSPETEDVSPGA